MFQTIRYNEKEPASARANTGIQTFSLMGYYQDGGDLVGVPPLGHGGGDGVEVYRAKPIKILAAS